MPIQNKTGQKIAFAVAQTVKGARKESFPQCQRPCQPFPQKIGAKRFPGIPADQPRRNERSGIDAGRAQHTPARIGHQHVLSRLECGKRGAPDIHLIAEHPQMPGQQTALLSLSEKKRFHVSSPLRPEQGR